MHPLISLGTVCLALSTQLLASPVRLESRQTATSCGEPLHLIVAGGNNTVDQNSLLQSLVDDINGTYPGTTEYLVPFDGSDSPCGPAGQSMSQAIPEYVSSCPDVPIVLLGYSCGGIAVMNTLCGGINSDYTKNIIAAITYGEETQVAGEPYDEGTCTNSAPTYARSDPSTCDAYAPVIHGYCDSGDPECCAGGTDSNAHFEYATNYDSDALAWIKSQYSSMASSA